MMKLLLALFATSLLFVACNKKEEAAAPVEEVAPAMEDTAHPEMHDDEDAPVEE